MSLKDRLSVRPVVKARFEQQIEALPKDELDALMSAVMDPAWSNAALMRALADEKIPVGKDTFGPWRKRVIDESR